MRDTANEDVAISECPEAQHGMINELQGTEGRIVNMALDVQVEEYCSLLS